MEEFCCYISKFNNIWFAQNIEVVDYISALKSLRFSNNCEIAYNPTSTDVWIGVDGNAVKISAGERRKL